MSEQLDPQINVNYLRWFIRQYGENLDELDSTEIDYYIDEIEMLGDWEELFSVWVNPRNASSVKEVHSNSQLDYSEYFKTLSKTNLHTTTNNSFKSSRILRGLKNRMDTLEYLYNQGIEFILPVYFNTKRLAWRHGRFSPITLKTLKKGNYKRIRQKNVSASKRPPLYDFAVQTGAWKMPDRDPNKILIVIDIDDWRKISKRFISYLRKNPTYVMRTTRGYHFYYWTSRWFSKTKVGIGADWLAKGSIAVVTGEARYPIFEQPVADLPDEHADYIYGYIRDQREQLSEAEACERALGMRNTRYTAQRAFKAIGGERNYRINATLYAHRYLSYDALEEMALELAAKCDPPYPEQEARYIAKSIYRNRARFPRKENPVGAHKTGEWSDDKAYVRLSLCFPKASTTFTRHDYEAKLIELGWEPNKDNRIAAARQDIARALENGQIKLIGKISRNDTGRPRNLYQRVEEYRGDTQFMLPIKPTVRNIRLSLMCKLIPDDNLTEIICETMRHKLGVGTDRTINTYATLLTGSKLLGKPLIRRETQQPYISSSELNPRSRQVKEWPLKRGLYYMIHARAVHYRPSRYQKTRFYHNVMQNKQIVLEKQNKGGKGKGGRRSTNQHPSPLDKGSRAFTSHKPCNKTNIIAQTPPKLLLEHPQEIPDETRKAIDAVRKKRLSYIYGALDRPESDYCEISKEFFTTWSLPLRGVHPRIEDEHFPGKPAVLFYYCPNPQCSGKIHTAHYNDYQLPARCPHCDSYVGQAWVKRRNPPEEALIGYPVNYYTNTWQTLFDVMDFYWERRIGKHWNAPFMHPGYEFEVMFEEAQLVAWREYRKTLYTTEQVACEQCGDLIDVEVRKGRKPPQIAQCEACLNAAVQAANLPATAQNVLNPAPPESLKEAYQRLMTLFIDCFGTAPRKKFEIKQAIEEHGAERVELAIWVTHKRKDEVRWHFPYVKGVLENWAAQGHINQGDVEMGKQKRGMLFAESWQHNEADVALSAATPYIAYDRHIDRLDRQQAYFIMLAEEHYGAKMIIEAIAEALRYQVRDWLYIEAILERMKNKPRDDDLW